MVESARSVEAAYEVIDDSRIFSISLNPRERSSDVMLQINGGASGDVILRDADGDRIESALNGGGHHLDLMFERVLFALNDNQLEKLEFDRGIATYDIAVNRDGASAIASDRVGPVNLTVTVEQGWTGPSYQHQVKDIRPAGE
ncbi:hypothetical protein EXS54_00785 [Patescibacteria group bacterium]|nr:hypothetical protein [Patescibacteria group bacterium]